MPGRKITMFVEGLCQVNTIEEEEQKAAGVGVKIA